MNAILNPLMSFVLTGLWQATWQASALALVVLIIQKTLGKRLGGRGRFALWAIVLVRLLLPAMPQSRFSVFNLVREKKTTAVVPQVVVTPIEQPQLTVPIIVIGPSRIATPQAAEPIAPVQPIASAPILKP